MQLQLPFDLRRLADRCVDPAQDSLKVGGRCLRMALVPNRRARRYILRLQRDNVVRVTIPRGGSKAEARRFADRNTAWLERQLLRQAIHERPPAAWNFGTEILFRGQRVKLEPGINSESNVIRFGNEALRVKDTVADLRAPVQAHLWGLARNELSARVIELAAIHQVPVRRVLVRNQRSRWGSCSRNGTVSLNWRLIQAPEFVRDYLILHELAHFKEMNHSRRFWREVARACPDFSAAERWLKQHAALLK